VLRDDAEVQKLRQIRGQQAQQQMQMQLAGQAGELVKSGAEVDKKNAEARQKLSQVGK
jgi:hypothetical protein